LSVTFAPNQTNTNHSAEIYNFTLSVDKLKFMIKEKPIQGLVKRVFDIIVSLSTIIVLSPVFLLLIVLIKLDSKGSAIFKQERVGLNEKIFYMYKFRSMIENAEEEFEKVKKLNNTNHIMFKSNEDPRITKIGKFLRKSSLDELPQLFNILKGDMSLVGPRPPLPRELINYEKWHHVKFLKPQGLTGLWQVSGRANIKDFDKVISLDYDYIRHWNLWMDLKIILKTIPVVLSAKGAD
jgi:lipopolysaccharide/colanic/teichoic acid biosynthesis glycosyltransferase